MLKSGLVSITFRKLTPRQIVELVQRAGLEGIEWGGDVHVPHGDLETAKSVRQLTQDAGLYTAAYGSYYRLGEPEPDFSAVLKTAKVLGAPTIRVWGGVRPSEKVDEEYYQRIVEDARRIARMAQTEGIVVALEFHGGTITDTNETTLRFLADVAEPNLKSYWQPAVDVSVEYRIAGLKELLPYLVNVHTFYWEPRHTRRALAEGETVWKQYLEVIKTSGKEHWLLVEFVRDDEPEAFMEDAKTLLNWLR
ncbi:MAG TPA: sugar phosphate isomerase/epimerase [Firmicutes bacterium]|nr:sugar phosphate isomerase/epimerase [Bacillota bacterium]